MFPIPVGSPSALATRANAVPGVVRTVALAAGVLAAGAVIPALAQATRHEARPAVRAVPPVARDAVTAPVAPDVINRDASGRVAIRATRLDTALTIDGHLDESTYRQVKSFGGFIQQEPQEGRPSSVSTDVWVFFDDQAVYVAARCWQDASLPLVANDLRRDGPSQFDNDNFAVIFDTFLDRRNGFMFQTNPLGSINDQLMTDEGAGSNRDWNAVWDLRTSRDAEGWSVEMRVPFRSLRFPRGQDQVWGINFRRNIQARTEYAYLSPVPASAGRRGLARLSRAATLVGLQVPGQSARIDVKPAVVATLATDHEAAPPIDNDVSGRVGLDVKAGIGSGLTADVTVNTDFAQVEEDEAQVNLSRFSLFQPEKREFFLEGLGLFAFGGVANTRTQSGGGPPIAPVVFFSRRIGLADGTPVDIVAGGRITGRVGAWSVGGLQLRQDASVAAATPVTDFTVLRLRRDLFRRGSVGAIYTRRSHAEVGGALNQVGGADLLLAPTQDLTINAYVARSDTPGTGNDDASYRARIDYNADRAGIQAEYLVVGDDFTPDTGLMRREDFRRSFVEGRIGDRPRGVAWLRKWNLVGGVDYITDNDGAIESRTQSGAAKFELANGDGMDVTIERSFEALEEPLELADGREVPVGAYGFTMLRGGYQLSLRHKVSGDITVGAGSFYGGSIREVTYRGRLDVIPRLALEPNVAFNRIDVPSQARPFWVNVIGLRGTWPFSPRASVGMLVQYRSDGGTIGASARLRWEYRPGSDLFVVITEGREVHPTVAVPQNRTIAVKFTRLLRF